MLGSERKKQERYLQEEQKEEQEGQGQKEEEEEEEEEEEKEKGPKGCWDQFVFLPQQKLQLEQAVTNFLEQQQRLEQSQQSTLHALEGQRKKQEGGTKEGAAICQPTLPGPGRRDSLCSFTPRGSHSSLPALGAPKI